MLQVHVTCNNATHNKAINMISKRKAVKAHRIFYGSLLLLPGLPTISYNWV